MTCQNCLLQLEVSADLMGLGFLFNETGINLEREIILEIRKFFNNNYNKNLWLIGKSSSRCLNSVPFIAKKPIPKIISEIDFRKSEIFQLAMKFEAPDDVLCEIKKLDSGSPELLTLCQFFNFACRTDELRFELGKSLAPFIDVSRNGNTLTSVLFDEDLEEDEDIKKWVDFLRRNALHGHDAQSRANNIVAEWILKVEKNPELAIHLHALRAMNCWNLFKS